MSFIGVEVQLETTAPPPEKNPGSAPAIRTTVYYNQTLTNSSFLHSQCLFVAVQAPVSSRLTLTPQVADMRMILVGSQYPEGVCL